LILASSATDTNLAAFSRLPLKAFETGKNYHAGTIFLSGRLKTTVGRGSGSEKHGFPAGLTTEFQARRFTIPRHPFSAINANQKRTLINGRLLN
jgi:hypothetical protein